MHISTLFHSLNPQDIKAIFDLGHDNRSNQVGAEKLFAGAQLYILLMMVNCTMKKVAYKLKEIIEFEKNIFKF